jgi:sugar phosphate isomerase/epimerase
MDQVDSRHVGLCWNCNNADLEGEGLEANFNLVKDRFGDTVHIRELDGGHYPYPKLIDMLVDMDYTGWVLLECRGKRDDLVAAYRTQRTLFDQLVTGHGEVIK